MEAPPRLKLSDQYLAWKKVAPYLYDFLIHDKLTWPCLSCRWGRLVPAEEYEASDAAAAPFPAGSYQRQQLFLSEQTDGSAANKLLILEAEVPRPRTATAAQVSGWSELEPSPLLLRDRVRALLLHPGEVNRLRELPTHPHVVVTATDGPEALVWNTRTQPVRGTAEAGPASVPDARLGGHRAEAPFALGCCGVEPRVASGADDGGVLAWDLGTSLAAPGRGPARLAPTCERRGHTLRVEDVVWRPGSAAELASVGDDGQLLWWDARGPRTPVRRVRDAHGAGVDVHAVDWAGNLLATGGADGSVRVWDARRLPGAPLRERAAGGGAVLRVEWSPQAEGVLATASDDGAVSIWDVRETAGRRASLGPPDKLELVFRHAGHRTPVVDFQWNPALPWTLMSVSDDAEDATGGGTLQLWRVSDLLTRPEEQALAELDQYRQYIGSGNLEDLDKIRAKASAGAR